MVILDKCHYMYFEKHIIIIIENVWFVSSNLLLFCVQSPDPTELPVLELDLGWELPDFAAIGEEYYENNHCMEK